MNNPSEKKLEALETSLTNLTTSWEKRLNELHAKQKIKAPLKNLEKSAKKLEKNLTNLTTSLGKRLNGLHAEQKMSAKKLGNNMQRFKAMNRCLQELKQLAQEKQDYLF